MTSYKDISEVFGMKRKREEVLQELKSNRKVYPAFLNLRKEHQEEFIQFCMGVRGLKMTYDSFFKHIFDAEKHPERLSEMLSAIIGKRLKVKRALPLEHMQISDKGSLLIMDIVVEFETGELADVEIQKVGYLFPGQRACCYSADMIMRQYEREKSMRGEKFSYKDLKKVYTIVLVEKSSNEFWKMPETYIHRGKIEFDSEIELELLHEYYFIPLDIFFHIKHNEDDSSLKNDLEAWLYFLASDKPEDILRVINSKPRFVELYQEICEFQQHPEVAIMMFSEALRKMDENLVQYMIEEQKKELEQNAKLLEQQGATIEQQGATIEQQGATIEQQGATIEQQKHLLDEKDNEIERLKKLLAEKEA